MKNIKEELRAWKIRNLEGTIELYAHVFKCDNLDDMGKSDIANGIIDLEERYKSLTGHYYQVRGYDAK